MNEAVFSDRTLWERAERGAALRVEGAFTNGVYFSFPDGRLLMLHDSRYGSLPFGAAVKGLEGRGRALGLETGMAARLTAEALRVEAVWLCFPLRFCAPAPPSGTIAVDFLQKAAPLAVMPEDLFSRTAAPALKKLRRGLETGETAPLRDAARGLIGLGRGLTPTYDDYLTGLLSTLRYAGSAILALEEAVLASLERTNRFSAAFLRAAAEGGQFSLLAECLETGSAEALQRLLAVGSSSGRDMLAGMCEAVRYISWHNSC